MDVTNAEQARIAEEAGAVAVMALERVPADIRADGGVARMASPRVIKEIQEAVTIPVMAKARIGHFAEAQVLQSLEVDYIDESEVLTPADEAAPHRQARLRDPVRLRRDQPGRGAAPDRRGRGDDPLQGRGRDRQHRRGRPPHARDHVGGIKRARARWAAEELAAAAKEHRAPLEVVARGRRARLAAGAAVLRRRHRDPGRRRADDAARRRGQLRRLGDLQVARTRSGAPGRSSRRRPTSTTPSASPPRRRARRADARRRHRRSSPRASCCSSAAGGERSPSGCGRAADRRPRLQGDFAAHARCCARSAPRPRGARRPSELEGLDGLVIPGGEIDDDREGDRARRARGGDPRPRRRRPARSSAPAPA